MLPKTGVGSFLTTGVVVSFLTTGVVVSFLMTGVVDSFWIKGVVVSFFMTGVIGVDSFLTVDAWEELVFDGVDWVFGSVLIVTGVDEDWPFIAAAFLAYRREECRYLNVWLIGIHFCNTHNISDNSSK